MRGEAELTRRLKAIEVWWKATEAPADLGLSKRPRLRGNYVPWIRILYAPSCILGSRMGGHLLSSGSYQFPASSSFSIPTKSLPSAKV